MLAAPARVPDVVGVAFTVTVTDAPLARLPRSHAIAVPVLHEPWLAVTLPMMSEGSRLIASTAPDAEFGPEFFTDATHWTAVPVGAVAGAVSEIERSAGAEERSFTNGDWKIKIWLLEVNALGTAATAMPFWPQRTILRKLVG